MADQHTSGADDTTPDIWAALPDQDAALWRGLDGWSDNFDHELQVQLGDAKRAVLAGKLDAVGDPRVLLSAARQAVEKLTAASTPETTTAATFGELAASYWQRIAEQREAAPTGLPQLDKALGGGLQPGRLMVLLGAPGVGKTTLANQIGDHIADSGRPVVYLTMEDPAWVLAAKTIARFGGLDYGAVLRGQKAFRSEIDNALADVSKRRSAQRLLYVEQFGRPSLSALQDMAAQHFARYGVDAGGGSGLLIIDYLQRVARAAMPAGADSALRLAVSDLTDQLRDIARALDCTVLALGSQNRPGYKGSDPLASGKESGDIEYGCDVLAAIGKEEDQQRSTSFTKAWSLNLAKNRQGETRTIRLDWYPERQQFTEAAK